MARILVVDDDRLVRDALELFLGREGHEVVVAADGANGILAFRNNRVDLVILDRNLPLVSGSGVFEEIRRRSKTVPVVMLTGYDSPEEAAAYLNSGAAAFLSKGDGLLRVLEEVARLLAPATPAGAGASGRKAGLILVADDDEGLRGLLSKSLARAGYTIITAPDGAAAEVLAREKRPDIVLLDILMPRKNGVEVLKELAAEMPEMGIIMISGGDDEETARDCLNLGAVDYISKPFNLPAVTRTIGARLLLQGGAA